MTATAQAVTALNEVYEDFVATSVSDAHSVCIGVPMKDGVYQWGEEAICVTVPNKMNRETIRARGLVPIPHEVNGMRVDIQEAPIATPELLYIGDGDMPLGMQAQTGHRSCHTPVLGGCQIQPEGANWVGTFGCMVVINGKVKGITNAHVTGIDARGGLKMYQPSTRTGEYFARVDRVHELTRDGEWLVDLAIIEVRDRTDKHSVIPRQLGVGTLGKNMVDAELGMRVVKTGRTTGVTEGRCVGIKSRSQVNYGKFTATFRDQDRFAKETGGQFSAGGDSGSAILTRDSYDFVALLFAGGGGQTIGNPSRHLREQGSISLFQGEYRE